MIGGMDLRRDPCPTCKHDPLGYAIGGLVAIVEHDHPTETPNGAIAVRWPIEDVDYHAGPRVTLTTDPADGSWARRVRRAARRFYEGHRDAIRASEDRYLSSLKATRASTSSRT